MALVQIPVKARAHPPSLAAAIAISATVAQRRYFATAYGR
jgi:hypothetical protein